ncbi:MarR family winged helix-turn-helix transcriptional regulator [Roseomonas populi]|uniref:MarR family winged helix-turn-helix transcriptional regulator n=1 Tax=Roseomonas populi TaxID=3121582 RepID=A0ABT1X553_9PROT|nr:MarR family winged helix-turn-helix transcriptional regulator [Roseomonas pecuniae]MCR0983240.1 MarR family winged helix-turn-helix transcriptional regulator [Roseomonas pecuniae]
MAFTESYLPYLLARASHEVSSTFHASLKGWDLSVPEWRVLACLSDIDGLGVGQLAAMALMKQPSMTKVLDRMEADGLVRRRSTREDRRRVLIHLTPKGRARVRPVLAAARAHQDSLLAPLGGEERALILRALRLLIGEDEGGAPEA